MTKKIPEGWQLKKLSQCGKIITGKTPSKKVEEYWNSEDVSFIKPDDFTKDTIIEFDKGKDFVSFEGFKVNPKIPPYSVLTTCIGNIGKVLINKNEATTNQQINTIVPNEDILYKYLAYAILKIKPVMIQRANAPVVPMINKTDFGKFEIPVPPLPQQEKIVKVLDITSVLIEKQKELIKTYDLFLKAKFVEMFGDPVKNPMGWEVEKLKSSMEDVRNGLSRRSDDKTGEVVLKLKDIRENHIRFENLNRIELDEKEKEKYIAEKDDLLFIRVNGNPDYVGRCSVFSGYTEDVYFNDHIMRIKVNQEKYNSVFLGYIVNSLYGKKQILKYRKTSAGQHTISQDGLERLSFYLPLIELQCQFASIVEKVETIKEEENKKLEHLELLHDSLMSRAFKGEIG